MNNIIAIDTSVQDTVSITSLLSAFQNYLNVKKVTEESYAVCLRCFMEWLRTSGVTQPTRIDIIQYAKYLSEPHPRRTKNGGTGAMITFSAGTQARYLRAVKLFFKWTAAENLYPNIADNVKGAKVRADNSKRDALEKTDARKLLTSIDRTTVAGKRDYAMILLSITAGLRIIEMQRADVKDIETLAGERVLYIQGKGHDEKDAYKKLTPEVYEAIADYLNARSCATGPLFASAGNRSNGKRLTEPSISRIIKDRMKAAGYDTHRLSAHSLRHTSVTFLLESGATLQEAQAHARHAAPATTEIYAHNLDQKKAHTEQRIYNFLFDKVEDQTETAIDLMSRMTAEQQSKALEMLRLIAG